MEEENVFGRLIDGCLHWIDDELSMMEKEERMKLYESYSWMFSDGCDLVSLEPLIVGNDPRVNSFRKKFVEWFQVVCDYSLDPHHLGKTSYSHYLNHPYWRGTKGKGNKVYPQRVILTLGMMGIFNAVKTDYLFVQDKTKDHGRVYEVNMERLNEWTMTPTTWDTPQNDSWVMTSSSDDDFDYSFLEGDDEESLMSWTLYDDWFATRQKETISSLEVIPDCYEKAKGFLETFPYKVVNDLSKEKKKQFRKQYKNCRWLVSLHNGKVGRCKVDDKGGRFYSLMVGMGKDYRRNCLSLEGERIVEVDVSSSQPTLIGLRVKKETGNTTQWLSHCLSGDFYDWVKGITGTNGNNNKIKKYVMRYLFSCYSPELPKDYEGEHLPPDLQEGKKGYRRFEGRLTSFLKDNDPDVYSLIDDYKRHPYWNEKVWIDKREKKHYGKWCSGLPVEMQKVEVGFIQTCLSRLPENLLFYTIHDAICVKESDGEKVRETMEKVSQEMYGEKIYVKIENTSM